MGEREAMGREISSVLKAVLEFPTWCRNSWLAVGREGWRGGDACPTWRGLFSLSLIHFSGLPGPTCPTVHSPVDGTEEGP